MAEPTITEVFGAGASQTGTTLTIDKADLAAAGLSTATENTAESLLAAILVLAQTTLTESNFETNSDQSVTVVPGFSAIVQRDDGTGVFADYRQTQFNVNFHKADGGGFDPDDY